MNTFHTHTHTHTCTPQDIFNLHCLWVCQKIRHSVGTSEMEVPRGSVSHPRNKYMFRYCVGTSGLCRKFRSNVPTGSGEMFRTECMFRLTVGTSDPCRKFRCGSSQGLCECSDSQLHVPTHCRKFRAWELKFEFCKSFWTCRKIQHTPSEDPTHRWKIRQGRRKQPNG